MPKPITTIGEYSILPVSIPATSAYAVQATHHIYVRPHAPKIPTPADARSLFLVNIPVDSTESHVRALFAALLGAGRFETVVFENERRSGGPPAAQQQQQLVQNGASKKRKLADVAAPADADLPRVWDRPLHRSGSTAVAVLADERSAEAALKAIAKAGRSGEHPVWGAGVVGKAAAASALGSARYLTHQKMRYAAKETLQAAVDGFMGEWNRREEEAARAAKRMRNVPDADGFVTVTRGGRVGPARMHDAEEARRKEVEREEAKRKSMGDFYRFQGRERRKEEQGELLKRFEEDRKRVEDMKSERRGRFRPE